MNKKASDANDIGSLDSFAKRGDNALFEMITHAQIRAVSEIR